MATDQDPLAEGDHDIDIDPNLTGADSESTASFFQEGLKNFQAESKGEKVEPEKVDDGDPAEPAAKEKPEKVVAEDDGDPKKKMKWGELKKRATDADAYEKEIVELKKKQEEFGMTQTKIDELQAKITEREEKLAAQESELMVSRLESTKSYKEKVDKPMQAYMGNIRRLAEAYQISVDDITAAIDKADVSIRNNLLTELSEGMNRRDQADFDKTTDGILEVIEADATLRADAKAAVEADKRKNDATSEQTKKERLEAYQAAASKVWSTMEKKLSALLIDKKVIDEAKVSGDAVNIDDSPPDIRAGATYALHLVPGLTKALEAKNARIKELETNLANRSRSSSSVGTHSISPSDDDEEDDGLSIAERFSRQQRGVRV